MKRIVWKYGLISGIILAALTAVLLPLCMARGIDFDHSEIIGYSSMVLAFLLVFFGIRSYRESIGGGSISFARAFRVGILITLVTCAFYVVAWEIVYYGFLPDFAETWSSFTIEKMREEGATEEAIAETERKMAQFRELYANPLFNVLITFMEVFPVGLIVTLVSAAILRRKPGGGAPSAAAAAA
ncbi:MAG TPA: DUF4199 domain-containing protein [Thermoanaerobaculia bacterium]|nr:DUF4199 domain-containing protein [Thermoanaerobaculia bacterium]